MEGYPSAVLEGGGEAGGYGGRDRFIMINIIDLSIGEAGRVSWHRRFTSPSPPSSVRPCARALRVRTPIHNVPTEGRGEGVKWSGKLNMVTIIDLILCEAGRISRHRRVMSS